MTLCACYCCRQHVLQNCTHTHISILSDKSVGASVSNFAWRRSRPRNDAICYLTRIQKTLLVSHGVRRR